MKVEVFTFNGSSDIATNRQINEWLKERKPRIVKWMQSESAVMVDLSPEERCVEHYLTITIVYLDEDEK